MTTTHLPTMKVVRDLRQFQVVSVEKMTIRQVLVSLITLDTEHTVYAIAKATGISQSVISRFISGGDITLSNVDKLATFYGYATI